MVRAVLLLVVVLVVLVLVVLVLLVTRSRPTTGPSSVIRTRRAAAAAAPAPASENRTGGGRQPSEVGDAGEQGAVREHRGRRQRPGRPPQPRRGRRQPGEAHGRQATGAAPGPPAAAGHSAPGRSGVLERAVDRRLRGWGLGVAVPSPASHGCDRGSRGAGRGHAGETRWTRTRRAGQSRSAGSKAGSSEEPPATPPSPSRPVGMGNRQPAERLRVVALSHRRCRRQVRGRGWGDQGAAVGTTALAPATATGAAAAAAAADTTNLLPMELRLVQPLLLLLLLKLLLLLHLLLRHPGLAVDEPSPQVVLLLLPLSLRKAHPPQPPPFPAHPHPPAARRRPRVEGAENTGVIAQAQAHPAGRPPEGPCPALSAPPAAATPASAARGAAAAADAGGGQRHQVLGEVEVARARVDPPLLVGEVQGAVERLVLGAGVIRGREEALAAAAGLLAAAVLDVHHVVRLVPPAEASPVALGAEVRVLWRPRNVTPSSCHGEGSTYDRCITSRQGRHHVTSSYARRPEVAEPSRAKVGGRARTREISAPMPWHKRRGKETQHRRGRYSIFPVPYGSHRKQASPLPCSLELEFGLNNQVGCGMKSVVTLNIYFVHT